LASFVVVEYRGEVVGLRTGQWWWVWDVWFETYYGAQFLSRVPALLVEVPSQGVSSGRSHWRGLLVAAGGLRSFVGALADL
jgi:hypothetical protein